MLRAITERVHNEPQVRFRREQPLLLRDVFLQNVVLECPAELLERNSPPFRHRQVHCKDDRSRAVDGHRRRHLIQRDTVEQPLHVLQRGDGDAAVADFPARLRMVGIQAH